MDIREQATIKDYLSVGAHTYGQPIDLRVWPCCAPSKLCIGRYCSISPGVTVFLGGNHRTDWISTYPFAALKYETAKDRLPQAIEGFTHGDVVIGNDVWVGSDATIMSGVTVGNGSVIASGALVTKSCSPYSIIGGNPAKLLRHRFDAAKVCQLLAIRWWDWPDADVAAVAGILSSGDVQALHDWAVSHGHLV